MTGNSTPQPAFDETAPIDVGFLDDDFGIIFPSDSGFNIQSQTGGVSCRQLEFSGVFLPMRHPTIRRDYPDWYPDTTGGVPQGETHPVADVDLTSIPDDDYDVLPPWVKERNPVQFYNWDEFSYYLDECAWWYSHGDLIEELRRWNYCPDGSIQNSRDMTRVWDSLNDIWAAIENELPFTYEEYDYHGEKMDALRNDTDFSPPLSDDYPAPCEGIKWITITGSKMSHRGNPRTPWAEQLAGETVILSTPNSD